MIATGGLLRINARRQDSLKNKTQKTHPHKKRSKKKRRSEVVVVKGKLKLFSVSGLVAALGILVLMVGVVMAALGYWPRDGLFFSARPKEGATMKSVSTSSSTPAPADVQEGDRGEEQEEEDRGGRAYKGDTGGGADISLNKTEIINGTSGQPPLSFLEDFLDRYLYSDRLKVLGPLIMGIGIFLFICANAVLHENRDKKTKVINLRDIYSTVIDLHSLRKPNAASGSTPNPLNGLINYVQSKSLETKPRAYPASLMKGREGGGGGEEEDAGGEKTSKQLVNSIDGGGAYDGVGGDTVFSIYQKQQEDPAPSSPSTSDRLSLPPSLSPLLPLTFWSSFQREVLSSFTLPLRRPRPAPLQRRHSARARTGGLEREREPRMEGRSHSEEGKGVFSCLPPPQGLSRPPSLCQHSSAASCSSLRIHQGVPEGSQDLLLLSSSSFTPSHLSLSSLSHLLYTSATPAPPFRRRSLPSCGAAGYSKLTHGEGESFESSDMTSARHVTTGGQRSGGDSSHREFFYREEPRMMSQMEDQSEAGLATEAQIRGHV